MKRETKAYDKNFILVAIGQIISTFGASLLRFALSLYILDITGRADVFATVYAISNIPRIIMPLGGAIADRLNKRNLMVIYDFSSSFIILGLFLLISTDKSSVFMISVIMIILSIISTMYTPTVTSSIPLLVAKSKIESANGIVTGIQAISDIIAPIIGGILFKFIGVDVLIIFSCTAFFLSAVMETFIKIPFTRRKQDKNIVNTIIKDMKVVFKYVVKEPFILKAMILAGVLNFILSPFLSVGVPIILREIMQSSDTMDGIGLGRVSFSTILGALTIGIFTKFFRMNTMYRWLIAIALLFIPIAIAVMPDILKLGYYPGFIVFMLGMIPASAILMLLDIFVISKVQKKTNNENLGKVMAIIMAVSQCVAPLGQVIYGVVFETFRTRIYQPILLISIILFVVAAITQHNLKNEDDVYIKEFVKLEN